MKFDPIEGMGVIEGTIADLAARNDKPQGYPFSKITIFSVYPEIAGFMPNYKHVPAANLPSMKKLDFKKAGKVFGSKVQEMKNDLSQVPEDYLIIASRFDAVDELTRKTTGCRKYMVEVEIEPQENRWLVIQFRKVIKKYVTEDLGINIVPPVFGEKYPELNEAVCPRVTITVGDCKEALYQALTHVDSIFDYPYDVHRRTFAEQEFVGYPIRIFVPSRLYIANNLKELSEHSVDGSFGKCSFKLQPSDA